MWRSFAVRIVLSVLVALAGCGRTSPTPAGPAATAASAASRPASWPSTQPASVPAALPVSQPGPRSPTRPATATTTATTAATTTPTSAPSAAEQRLKRIRILTLRVDELYKARQYAEAAALLHELVQVVPGDSRNWYNLACLLSLSGQTDAALQTLETAVDKGYVDIRHMERDEDLAALRGKAAFRRILERRDEIQRKRAQAVLGSMKKQLGDANGYVYEMDHENRLIFGATVDAETLRDIREYLTGYAQAMSKGLFTHGLEQYVAVVVPKEGTLRGPVGGYYDHARHMLVARSIGMVLTHEFTHALHAADQEALGQHHPIWVVEGLATLYETSEIRDGAVHPLPNHRLNILQRLIRSRQTIPLADFIKFDPRQFMAKPAVAYPEARYIFMYLYEKGLLRKWYEAYVSGFADDPTGAAALEEVLGRKLADVQEDWIQWVKALPAPPVSVTPGHAYLGVAVRSTVDGLLITQVVRGSGANLAGIKPGDVIVKIDGKRLVDPEDLILLVTGREVGDEVSVEYRRDQEEHTAAVALKAMPARPARPRPATRRSTTSSTAPTSRSAPTQPDGSAAASRPSTSSSASRPWAPSRPVPRSSPQTQPAADR